jgi:hypothetical protein
VVLYPASREQALERIEVFCREISLFERYLAEKVEEGPRAALFDPGLGIAAPLFGGALC